MDGGPANGQAAAPQLADFDICWFDLAITPDILHRIKPYQRISQCPGIAVIAHKNRLGINLMQMQKEFQEENFYDFCPETFMLPFGMSEFRK